jgi:signal transduction histidine kinase
MPVDVKVALYRIAQEALNNVAKHAGASQVKVDLLCRPNHVTMQISDDGQGFKVRAVQPNSLGLNIMRERAKEIGAALTVKSQPGKGAAVKVIWKMPEKE